MESKLTFTGAQVAQLTGGSINQIERLIQIGAVTPAQPASRRGMNRLYDARNVAEIAIGIELMDVGVSHALVSAAIAKTREPELWAKLANPATRQDVAVLMLTRLSGFKSDPVPSLAPVEWVGQQCDAGYTIVAAVPMAYVLRIVERATGETFA